MIVKTLIVYICISQTRSIMKFFKYLPILLLPIFITCRGKNDGDTGKGNAADSTSRTTSDTTAHTVSGIEKWKEQLGNLIPLSKEELGKRLPGALEGAPATGMDVSDAMGALSASADYVVNDSLKITLEIVDCAGSGGVGFFSMQYESMMQPEEGDSETTYNVIDFRGHKALESCLKSDPGNCIFTFFAGNRFLVMIESRTAGPDLLKQIASGLELK